MHIHVHMQENTSTYTYTYTNAFTYAVTYTYRYKTHTYMTYEDSELRTPSLLEAPRPPLGAHVDGTLSWLPKIPKSQTKTRAVYLSINLSSYLSIHISRNSVYIHMCIHIHTHYILEYVHILFGECIYMYIYIHMGIYVHIHLFIYICIYIRI